MLITWFIGILLNLIIIFLWKHRYVTDDYHEKRENWHRIEVNVLFVPIFIISAVIPIMNILFPIWIWLPFILIGSSHDAEWRFPKWMNKTIK